ncbi:hypothetical protein CMUS01_16407 [Colletotrichum musicola]|uniref:Uncharacterized protein n=1 Tax=Colletotrichum musicola TaxID=2175873 RepID=A0A8H6MIM0_9PEZI|nr:hypothetical protein CMUS01_16407 [Colletotrichum musicola]
MASTPPQGPTDSSLSVQAHQNQISSASIMTTASSRSISTAPTGVKSDIENTNTINVTVNGACTLFKSLQHTENSSTIETRRSSSISPSGPSPWAAQGISESSPFSPSLQPKLAASSEPPPEIEGTETGLTVSPFESLPIPTSTTLAGYGECFDIVARWISDAYDLLRSRLKRTMPFKKRRRVRRLLDEDVKTQKSDYLVNNTSLIRALTNIQVTMNHDGNSTTTTCQHIYSALCTLWDHLHQVMSALEAMASTDTSQDRLDVPEAKKRIEELIRVLGQKLEDFKKFAQLVKDDSSSGLPPHPTTPEDTEAEKLNLKKLSVEVQVSTLFNQFLRRACSESCHESHWAYFSLEAELSNSDCYESSTGNEDNVWKCHMAFKSSTKKKGSLIWLRAKSTVGTLDQLSPTPLRASPRPSSEIPHTLPATDHEAQRSNPKKRRAASTPPGSPRKFQKTRPTQNSRRISEPAPHSTSYLSLGTQVCPETLGYNDSSTHLVMNMVDENGFDHQLLCLPKDERPRDEDKISEPITLSAILESSNTRLWILQLSRLIAEAVLRFDLRNSDDSMADSVVFYKSSKHDLTPFMELEIRKSDLATNVVDDERYVAQHLSQRLLDLGMILLRLGLLEKLKPRSLLKEDKLRSFVREKASDVCGNMGNAYSGVIKSCIKLSEKCEEPAYRGEGFKGTYYGSVLKPLRALEERFSLFCNK